MFAMDISHQNRFCQIVDLAFKPVKLIESIFMLETTFNMVVCTIKPFQHKKPIADIYFLQMEKLRSKFYHKRYSDVSDIGEKLSVDPKALYRNRKTFKI